MAKKDELSTPLVDAITDKVEYVASKLPDAFKEAIGGTSERDLYAPAIGDLVNVKYKGGSAKAYYKGIDADGNHLFSKANTSGKPMKAVVTFEGITGVEAVK